MDAMSTSADGLGVQAWWTLRCDSSGRDASDLRTRLDTIIDPCLANGDGELRGIGKKERVKAAKVQEIAKRLHDEGKLRGQDKKSSQARPTKPRPSSDRRECRKG
jgi:hypothetical protein